jgi:hypothetical protein
MQTCGEIGAKRGYETFAACLDGERSRVTGWWGDSCEAPSPSAVDACIQDVAGDFCPTSFDRVFIPAVGACAAPSVCRSQR